MAGQSHAEIGTRSNWHQPNGPLNAGQSNSTKVLVRGLNAAQSNPPAQKTTTIDLLPTYRQPQQQIVISERTKTKFLKRS